MNNRGNISVSGWAGVLVACVGIGVSITIPDIRCALGLQQQECPVPPDRDDDYLPLNKSKSPIKANLYKIVGDYSSGVLGKMWFVEDEYLGKRIEVPINLRIESIFECYQPVKKNNDGGTSFAPSIQNDTLCISDNIFVNGDTSSGYKYVCIFPKNAEKKIRKISNNLYRNGTQEMILEGDLSKIRSYNNQDQLVVPNYEDYELYSNSSHKVILTNCNISS